MVNYFVGYECFAKAVMTTLQKQGIGNNTSCRFCPKISQPPKRKFTGYQINHNL